METKFWPVDPVNPGPEVIAAAAGIIQAGGLVAFPTETVYGLGANGLDARAVEKIFAAKGRPSDNPLILHIADMGDVFQLSSQVPLQAQVLMETFWPGPLTIVLPKRDFIPVAVTAGLPTVAIRMPNHPVALELIKKAGVPIAAPSANRSGYPSPTTARHVQDDLAGRIEAILDGGPADVGLESTVLDLTGDLPVILRPGGVTKEQLSELLGAVDIDPGLSDSGLIPRAPGMKYTHYAPKARVILLKDNGPETAKRLDGLLAENAALGRKVGLLLTAEFLAKLGDVQVDHICNLGSRRDLAGIASLLYSRLRYCDQLGLDLILTETYEEKGLGRALMNRLLKSSGYTILE